jgi:GC-rich sequence DNA-binding factor
VARKSKLSQSISLRKLAATAPAVAAMTSDGASNYHHPFASSSSTPAAVSSVSYNNAYLEELKASTPMKAPRPQDSEDEPQSMEIDDVRDPSSSTIFAPSLSRYAPVLDTTQGIPDAAAIAAAKAKRKTATGTGVSSSSGLGGEDYVSINQDNGKLAVFDADARGDVGPHPESRLQREEDEDGDGDAGQC